LHADTTLMPRLKRCWASWNFLGSSAAGSDTAAVCVTYWGNRLQRMPADAPDLFVTLNPPVPPQPQHIIRRLSLAHPLFGAESWQAQRRIPEIQGAAGCVYYAGAWCGYGFHEDGMRAAVAAVSALGARVPWVPRATSPKMSMLEAYCRTRVLSLLAAAVAERPGALRVICPNGEEGEFGEADAADHPYAIVPPFATPQQSVLGSAATAIKARISVSEALEDTAPAVVGPGSHSMRCVVRVLDSRAFVRVVRVGLAGLVRSYQDRDVEVSDMSAFAALVLSYLHCQQAARCLGFLHWAGVASGSESVAIRPSAVDARLSASENLFDHPGAQHLHCDATRCMALCMSSRETASADTCT
jgi:hypothetical protein